MDFMPQAKRLSAETQYDTSTVYWAIEAFNALGVLPQADNLIRQCASIDAKTGDGTNALISHIDLLRMSKNMSREEMRFVDWKALTKQANKPFPKTREPGNRAKRRRLEQQRKREAKRG